MKNIINYLDDLKEKTGSDYKSAQELKIERSTIANIRKRGLMSDETAIKVADMLKISREELLLAAAIARSNEEVKKTWEKISRQIGMAAGIVLAIQTVTPVADNLTFGLCILC